MWIYCYFLHSVAVIAQQWNTHTEIFEYIYSVFTTVLCEKKLHPRFESGTLIFFAWKLPGATSILTWKHPIDVLHNK